MRTVSITTKRVNNVHRQMYGGYIMYWKLYAQLQRLENRSGTRPNVFIRMTHFLWLCVLKPLGQFYSSVTKISGEFTVCDGVFQNVSLVKSRSHRMFGLIFFHSKMKLTQEDIKKLME